MNSSLPSPTTSITRVAAVALAVAATFTAAVPEAHAAGSASPACAGVPAASARYQLRGTMLDSAGRPLAGARVRRASGGSWTIANRSGRYCLTATSRPAQLLVRHLRLGSVRLVPARRVVRAAGLQMTVLARRKRTSGSTTTTTTTTTTSTAGTVLFQHDFNRADGLITNEYATYNPSMPGIYTSPDWWMPSGSLFARSSMGWTGVPDAVAPNINSSTSTNSAIFRLQSKRADFGNVAVEFDLRINALTSTSKTPAVAWDGLHVPIRRQADSAVYYVTLNRRDGVLIIKKKTGSGTYCTLTGPEVRGARYIPIGAWQKVRVTARNNADGSVTVAGLVDGKVLTTATDTGAMCGAPLRGAGATGIRSDNIDATFDNFRVSAIS